MMEKPKRLGEYLVERGTITAEQLEQALQAQRASGEFLGALLIRLGWATEEQVLAGLSQQFGMPRVPLDSEPVDWSVAELFPAALLVEHTCFPIRQDARSVTVAISNPLDAWTISELEKQARGRKVQLVLCTGSEIGSKIKQLHQRRLRKIGQGPGVDDGQ